MDDLRQRSGGQLQNKDTSKGLFRPFGKHSLNPFSFLMYELKSVLKDNRGRKILYLGLFNVLSTLILLMWCKSTSSMGLSAYTYLTIFDLLSLTTCLVSLWVEQQKSNAIFTFGYERFEVLAVFASTILAQLSSFFILKESVERLIQQSEVHIGRLLPGIILAFLCHLVVTYGMQNRALNHVISASSSSWLQEHVAEMSQSVCHIVPGLSTILLPRVNPFVLLGWTGGIILIIAMILIEMYNYHIADSIAAIFIALLVCITMFPMSAYSGRILLQTTPPHIVGQLDKCLREASTLDGVLEFRNEHFWTLGFGTMAGTVHVRIRRDANEQLVLAHLTDRLSNLVSNITIQVFKDEWAWNTTTMQILNESALRFPPLNSSITPTVTSQLSSNKIPSKQPYTSSSNGKGVLKTAVPQVATNNVASGNKVQSVLTNSNMPSVNKEASLIVTTAVNDTFSRTLTDSIQKLPR